MTPKLTILDGVPLAPFTTLGIGGPARHYTRIGVSDQLSRALVWARERDLDVLVLGGGSNLLIGDEGFPGLVVHVVIDGVAYIAAGGSTEVTAGAGESWDGLVAAVVGRGLAGVECLSGIPGFVGATPIQNVGAYGQEVAETIVRVEVVDRRTAEVLSITNAECAFGYRDSRFKQADRDRYVVTSVTFRLVNDGAPAIRYPELRKHLEAACVELPSLGAVREAVLAIRRRKSMVVDTTDPDSRSAGSFFTNPIVTPEIADRIGIEGMPRYPAGDQVKLSAAWLIEQAGFVRGHIAGNVGLSTKHALAIVNRGGGTAREVVGLAGDIRRRVYDKFGVELVPEPVFVNVPKD